MNPFVCRLATFSVAVLLLAGCGKKKPVVSGETAAPSASPASREASLETGPQEHSSTAETPADASTTPGKEAGLSVSAPGSLTPEELRTGTDVATSGVPEKLLVNDLAYEAWFKKHGLDLNDPGMLDADSDGDGATNREEFVADSDPRNAKARPGIHKNLRLKEYSEVRVPLILESVTGRTAKIKRTDEGDSRSEAVTIGQTVGGMKVEKVQGRRETDKNGQLVDLSRVELEDPVSKAKVILIKDMPARSAASYAVLAASGGVKLKVHQGDVFHWPAETGTAYQVIDLRADQVVVQEVETQRVWTIPK
ncbi:MAG: Amuc_1099 family pilus-like system protein [Verrucomicrobiota bacterium]